MSKWGVIFCGYRCADLLTESLAPWLVARSQKPDGHQIVICAVSLPFEGFDNGPEDGTSYMLNKALQTGEIDHLITGETPVKETEARGTALKWLISQGCDVIWQADGDENPTLNEIRRTLEFISYRPAIPVFRGSLKNYVFNRQTYLTQPFTPYRAHRVYVGSFMANRFWDDNNILYVDPDGRKVKDIELATLTIPQSVAWVKHFSWISDDRSRRKCKYQQVRWPSCSFRWNDVEGKLEWNEEYFKKLGQSLPEVMEDK